MRIILWVNFLGMAKSADYSTEGDISMWISTAAWLKEREDSILLRLERDTAIAQAKQQETTLAWFMHRLTQVERERAQLLFNYTGVKTEAPVYEKDEKIPSGMENPLNALPNFDDVGEMEAMRLGISWDDEGKVVYGVTK